MKIGKIFAVTLCALTLFLVSGCQQKAATSSAPAKEKAPAATLAKGSGSFVMKETLGATKDDMKVFYYRPEKWTNKNPIMMVFHGMNRNADTYRDNWIKLADQYNFLVICPEFTSKKFPGVRYYNAGNVADVDEYEDKVGDFYPKKDWIFKVVDDAVLAAKKAAGAPDAPVAIFGHSAGAQMTHRYLLLGGDTTAKLIIPANAGWYTMPDANITFPYGIKALPISKEELAKDFAKPAVILLGEADVVRGKNLRQTTMSDAQGQNRLARGKAFYAQAKAKAAEMGVPFNWKLVTVPGVAHDNAGMAVAAAKLVAAMK